MSVQPRDQFADSKDVHEGVLIRQLESWEGFVDLIRTKHANCPGYIYRGQAHAQWKIESRLDRLERKHPRTKNYSGSDREYFKCPPLTREMHLSAFQEAARGKHGASALELSADEWWALAQHHGLATPMLDWTYSPFVALFFAFEEEKCTGPDGAWGDPKRRAVLSTGFHMFKQIPDGEDHPIPGSPTNDANYRLVNQAGLLLKMPQGRDLETIVRTHFRSASYAPYPCSDGTPYAQVVLEKIEMANTDRIECLKFLNKMNINRMSLFPDLDGAAQYVNGLWELDYDRILGYYRQKSS